MPALVCERLWAGLCVRPRRDDEDDVGARGAGELYEELPNSDILLPPDPYNDEREWMLAVGVEKLSERINWLLK